MITVNRLRLITERASAPPVDELHILSTDPVNEEERVSRSTVVVLTFDTDILESSLTPITLKVEMDDLLTVRQTIPSDEEEGVNINESIRLMFDHEVDETTITDETILVEQEV